MVESKYADVGAHEFIRPGTSILRYTIYKYIFVAASLILPQTVESYLHS